jgi:type III restriction enzyme
MSSKVEIDEFISLNDIDGFPWSRDFVDSDKSLFARITYDENENEIKIPSAPVDNNMEADFVRFLTRAEDVIYFIKNLRHVTKLGISYYDSRERKWRKFYPDFIVKAKDGYYLIETKGREEIQVPDKNISAKKWCEAISKATNEKWEYLYLREGDWTGKNKLSDLK